MNSSNAKTIAILIILLVLGYFLYKQFSVDDNSTVVVTETNEGVAAIGADIAILLNQINELQIDSELFTDPAYQSLTDLTNVITPIPQGKKNPFAPFVTAPTKAAPKAR